LVAGPRSTGQIARVSPVRESRSAAVAKKSPVKVAPCRVFAMFAQT
jgi:hypothetical protein